MTAQSSIELVPFESAPGLAVSVAWRVERRAGRAGGPPEMALELAFAVDDPRGQVLWPEPSERPGPRDGLWQHTCLELFVGLERASNYCEINASPGGDWAFYYFDDYRDAQPHVGEAVRPSNLAVAGPVERRVVRFEVDVRRIHDVVGHPSWRWQPTAVLETAAGLSYWAPSHPGERPDFHGLKHLPGWDPYGDLSA